jgi:hypothetical protein
VVLELLHGDRWLTDMMKLTDALLFADISKKTLSVPMPKGF